MRLTGRAIDPATLGAIEVVTSSHNHTDHLDHETLWPLIEANPSITMVIPEANRAFVADRLHTDPAWPVGLTSGASATVGAFRITALAVAHEDLDVDEHGRHRHLGYLVAAGPFLVFHSGDAVPGNFWGDEAAEFAHAIGAGLVVPMHFEMFAFNTETPDLFVATCERLGQPHYVARCGERIVIEPHVIK